MSGVGIQPDPPASSDKAITAFGFASLVPTMALAGSGVSPDSGVGCVARAETPTVRGFHRQDDPELWNATTAAVRRGVPAAAVQ
jgi:hypothetical protein